MQYSWTSIIAVGAFCNGHNLFIFFLNTTKAHYFEILFFLNYKCSNKQLIEIQILGLF